jgi:hypothetical protein
MEKIADKTVNERTGSIENTLAENNKQLSTNFTEIKTLFYQLLCAFKAIISTYPLEDSGMQILKNSLINSHEAFIKNFKPNVR